MAGVLLIETAITEVVPMPNRVIVILTEINLKFAFAIAILARAFVPRHINVGRTLAAIGVYGLCLLIWILSI